jgi:hypothetical protein
MGFRDVDFFLKVSLLFRAKEVPRFWRCGFLSIAFVRWLGLNRNTFKEKG